MLLLLAASHLKFIAFFSVSLLNSLRHFLHRRRHHHHHHHLFSVFVVCTYASEMHHHDNDMEENTIQLFN
jgi:hypothetical protein